MNVLLSTAAEVIELNFDHKAKIILANDRSPVLY